MKITIFGATGGVGRQAVQQAVEAGHQVTVVVRNPDGLPPEVVHVLADLDTVASGVIAAAVRGADAVLSCLGPRSKAEAQAGIVTKGTRLLVEAMQETGVRRLIVISAMPVGSVASPARPNPSASDPGDGWFTSHVLAPMVKTVFRDIYRDLAQMEDLVRESELDWTIARPPRLVNQGLTGRYRTDAERNMPGGRTISRADLAHFMLEALDGSPTIGQIVRVAY